MSDAPIPAPEALDVDGVETVSDLEPAQRAAAVEAVLLRLQRIALEQQDAIEVLAELAGVDPARLGRIERQALAEHSAGAE